MTNSQGSIVYASPADGSITTTVRDKKISNDSSLLEGDEIRVRDASRMPALLQRLSERRPESLDWLGVSYGLTPQLFKFWKKAGYSPLWVRQIANDLTGEYTTVMLRSIYERSSGADEDSAASTSASSWTWDSARGGSSSTRPARPRCAGRGRAATR